MRSIEVPGMRNPETHLPDLGINRTFAFRFRAHQLTPKDLTEAQINLRESAGRFVKSDGQVNDISLHWEQAMHRHNVAEQELELLKEEHNGLEAVREQAEANELIDLKKVSAELSTCQKNITRQKTRVLHTAKQLPRILQGNHFVGTF